MKCVICEKLSFKIICEKCLDFIPINPKIRSVLDVKIYSFFDYEEIDFLLKSKYHALGSRILKVLANLAANEFKKITTFSNVYGVGIDDSVHSLYSHTGIILKAFKKAGIKPIYGELKAMNHINYAGKSLEFRQQNKKNFIYKSGAKDLIIIDDIITTGESFKEAIKVVRENNGNVICGIALANAAKDSSL